MPEHRTTAHVLVLALRAALKGLGGMPPIPRASHSVSRAGALVQHLADAARRFLKTLFDRDRIGHDQLVLLVQDLLDLAHVRVHRQLKTDGCGLQSLSRFGGYTLKR